jgi:vitamin B12 transporter
VSWQAGDDLTLSASYGEGFKAPSLFQLLSDYGNGALDPERARSFDAGLRLDMGRYALSLTAFRRNTRGQIVFVGCFESPDPICANRPYGTYDNVARARSQGVEAEGTARLADGLEAGIAYALTASTNRDTGLRLARRPRHAGTFTIDWRVVEPLALGVDLRVVSASFDDPDNTVRMGGHALLDLRASWAASDHVEVFARVENARDERYQTAAGYATQGRAAFLGVRARL